MKNIITIMVLIAAATPLCAKSLDLNAVNLKTVREVMVSDIKIPPVQAAQNAAVPSSKGYTLGTKWYNYVLSNTGVNDGSSAVLDYTVDDVSYAGYDHISFGKLYVRFYTPVDPENPATVSISFKPGDAGTSRTVPTVVKKVLTFAKDPSGTYHYYADISAEVTGARLETKGLIFTQELSVTKQLPDGGSVKYEMPGFRLFDGLGWK